MPEKRPNENKRSFIQRCISSEVMKQEFPDLQQRIAVCINKAGGSSADALEYELYKQEHGHYPFEEDESTDIN